MCGDPFDSIEARQALDHSDLYQRTLSPGPQFVTSTWRGTHPDLLIIDDPVSTVARSEGPAEAALEWYQVYTARRAEEVNPQRYSGFGDLVEREARRQRFGGKRYGSLAEIEDHVRAGAELTPADVDEIRAELLSIVPRPTVQLEASA